MSDRFRCTTCSPLLDCMVFDGGMLSIASYIRTEDGRACTRRHLIQPTKRYHQPSPLSYTQCHAHFIISSMLAWRLQGVSKLPTRQATSLYHSFDHCYSLNPKPEPLTLVNSLTTNRNNRFPSRSKAMRMNSWTSKPAAERLVIES